MHTFASFFHKFRRLGFLFLVLGLIAGCSTPASPEKISDETPPSGALQNLPPEPTQPACQVLASVTPTPHQATYLLEKDHRYGPTTAPLTLVVYGDYQCEPCARLDAALWRLMEEHPASIQWVYRHYPLAPVHDKALMAVQAVEAAARQGRFWEAHRFLYSQQEAWRDLPPEDFPSYLLDMARTLKLDLAQFTQDLTDTEIQSLAYRAWQAGQRMGLDSVPVLFINGEWFPGPPTYEALRTVVALNLLTARRFNACPPWRLEAHRLYFLDFSLPQGRVSLRLEPEWALQGVNAVVFLAQEGWYEGMGIYGIAPNKAVFFGDPSNTGYGHPGFLIPWEAPAVPLEAGRVVLLPETPGWNSPRMAILLGPAPEWEGQVTVIGEVAQGLDGLRSLVPPPDGSVIPIEDITIRNIPIESTP